MSKSHARLKFFRQVHLYFGVFISPALLFFAFTGAMQTFSLHETTRGSSYTPPAWIVKLAQLHKKQTLEVQHRPAADGGAKSHDAAGATEKAGRDKGAGAPAPGASVADATRVPQPKPKSHLPMKCFFLLVSIGLFTSTLTGIYMAYKFSRGPWLITGLLAAGVVVPLLLLPF